MAPSPEPSSCPDRALAARAAPYLPLGQQEPPGIKNKVYREPPDACEAPLLAGDQDSGEIYSHLREG